jgi:diguanylate cyclase (GGDEF)-like protein
MLLAAEDMSELIDILLYKSIRHFDLSDCRLIWFDSEQEFLSLVSEASRQQFGHRLVFSGMKDDVVSLYKEDYKPILRALTPIEKTRWFPGKTHIESAAFVPLVCHGKLVGSLNFGSSDIERFTSDKAVDFMGHMGLIASVCLQNGAIREQVRLLSMMDSLTQVKNRRCFEDDISQEISRAQRNKHPLSCLFIDADFFKMINDNYGHQAGDEALRSLAACVKIQLREDDHIARYGGEEFAVLLPQCDEKLAYHVAERIRSNVEHRAITFDEQVIKLTLSIGVSTYTPEKHVDLKKEDAANSLIKQADTAVYDAKESGRNCVRVREFVSSGGELAIEN